RRENRMTHIIPSLCTRQGDCVEVCPVDCIVPGPKDQSDWAAYFYIDPETCIDCGMCLATTKEEMMEKLNDREQVLPKNGML
ncbi:MAG: ferredoxin family protein, partial [Candidatus Hodarchaeota archaeon]